MAAKKRSGSDKSKSTSKASKVKKKGGKKQSVKPNKIKSSIGIIGKQLLSDFCLCKSLTDGAATVIKSSGKTFRYQMVYGNYPGFAFNGYNNTQTVDFIRKAMINLGTVSRAKFIESNSSPHIRFYFMKTVTYNAIAVYMGSGKIYFSQTRPVTPTVINCAVQHEVGHYLNIKSNPPADKWSHCTDIKCIMNINGTATNWCPKCKAIMVSKYGQN